MSILNYQLKPVVQPRLTANTMKPLELFRTEGYEGLGWYMRITPTGFITNSKTIKENTARHNVFVVDISTGKFAIIDGNTYVIRAKEATLIVG